MAIRNICCKIYSDSTTGNISDMILFPSASSSIHTNGGASFIYIVNILKKPQNRTMEIEFLSQMGKIYDRTVSELNTSMTGYLFNDALKIDRMDTNSIVVKYEPIIIKSDELSTLSCVYETETKPSGLIRARASTILGSFKGSNRWFISDDFTSGGNIICNSNILNSENNNDFSIQNFVINFQVAERRIAQDGFTQYNLSKSDYILIVTDTLDCQYHISRLISFTGINEIYTGKINTESSSIYRCEFYKVNQCKKYSVISFINIHKKSDYVYAEIDLENPFQSIALRTSDSTIMNAFNVSLQHNILTLSTSNISIANLDIDQAGSISIVPYTKSQKISTQAVIIVSKNVIIPNRLPLYFTISTNI